MENLPVDDPPAVGEESVLWQIRGTGADTGVEYRGLSLWFRWDNLIGSVAVFDNENGTLPEKTMVAALADRFLARIEDVVLHGGPGLGDLVLRLGGERVTISRDHYRIMSGEVLPLLGETAADRAIREGIVTDYGLIDDYYVFATIAAGDSGPGDDRSFSVVVARFADSDGASAYLAGFQDRLAGVQLDNLDFPTDAPSIGDDSTAATYTSDVGGGVIREFVDVLIRVDRDSIRLRFGSPTRVEWTLVQELADQQIACRASGLCLDAIDPPAGLV